MNRSSKNIFHIQMTSQTGRQPLQPIHVFIGHCVALLCFLSMNAAQWKNSRKKRCPLWRVIYNNKILAKTDQMQLFKNVIESKLSPWNATACSISCRRVTCSNSHHKTYRGMHTKSDKWKKDKKCKKNKIKNKWWSRHFESNKLRFIAGLLCRCFYLTDKRSIEVWINFINI